MIVPTNVLPAPSVAEVPTAQNTLLACALLVNTMVLAAAVMSVLPIWKMNTALQFPPPSRVRVPVSAAVVVKQYTPGPTGLMPPLPKSVPVRSVVHVRLVASVYAAVSAASPAIDAASLLSVVPKATTPGGNPVIAVPGATPRFPTTTVDPVLVTVDPPRTA
jgi:hypothetical protein